MVLAISDIWWFFGAASVVSLAAFVVLIMVPAISSYGRWPEKLAAGFMSFFVLGTLVTIGILAGILYVLVSHDIIFTDFFPWSNG